MIVHDLLNTALIPKRTGAKAGLKCFRRECGGLREKYSYCRLCVSQSDDVGLPVLADYGLTCGRERPPGTTPFSCVR